MALNNLGLGIIFTAKDLASHNINKIMKSFQGLDSATNTGAMNMEKNMKLIGAGLTTMGVGISGLVIADRAVDQFAGFEREMLNVGIQASASAEQLRALSDSTMELSSRFGIENRRVASAFATVVNSGFREASEGSKVLSAAAKLAIGQMADLGVATKLTTDIMGAYKFKADQAERTTSALANVLIVGKADINELQFGFRKLVNLTSPLGIKIEELGAAMATLTGKTGNVREVSANLTNVLNTFIRATPAAKAKAQLLGIELGRTAFQTKGFAGVLKELAAASERDTATFESLFGSRQALLGLMPLLNEYSEDFTKNLAKFQGPANAATDAFNRMSASLSHAMEKIHVLKENFMTLIGEALAPFFHMAANVMERFYELFVRIPKPIIRAGAVLLLFGSIAAVLVGALMVLVGILPAIISGFALIGPALAAAGAAIAPFLPIILGIMAGIAYQIAVLVTVWKTNFGGIADFLRNAFDKVRMVFLGLYQLFSEGRISGPLVDDLTKAGNEGVLRFIGLIYSTAARLQAFGEGVIEAFKYLAEGFKPALQAMGGLIHTFLNLLELVLGMFGKKMPTAIGGSLGAWKTFGRMVGMILSPAITILSFLLRLVTAILTPFAKLIEMMRIAGGFFREHPTLAAIVPGAGLLSMIPPSPTAIEAGTGPGPSHATVSGSPGVAEVAATTGATRAGLAGVQDAMGQQNERPVVVNSRTVVELDGEKVGEAQQRYTQRKRVLRHDSPKLKYGPG